MLVEPLVFIIILGRLMFEIPVTSLCKIVLLMLNQCQQYFAVMNTVMAVCS